MTKKNSTTQATYEVGTTVHVAPDSLLMQRNIRDAKPDPDLVRSVKALGVLEPITARLTDEGGLLVRFGHRRTLAAIEAHRDTVPVYIAGDDSTQDDAEVDRIISQHDENTHRAGLTTAENLGVVEQLVAFGLSPAQIAKQARIKRAEVDTALTVSASSIARKATERYDSLTLDQAAVVAEFEADPETVKALVLAAHEGQFEHVAQRARDDRAEAQATTEVLAMLEDDGVTVIDRPDNNPKILGLGRLSTGANSRDPLSPTEHTECPGHVAWLGAEWVRVDATGQAVTFPDEPGEDASEDEREQHTAECGRIRSASRQAQRPVAVYGCSGWKTHGHHDLHSYGTSGTSRPKAEDMTEKERETAKAQRKLVVENNKAWAAAEPVRREHLAKFAKWKTPPKGTARFLAVALGMDQMLVGSVGANHLAAEWLGKTSSEFGWADLTPAKRATENRCLLHALVTVLAAYEKNLTDRSWRDNGERNAAGRYLRFLSDRCGYTLSEVEQYAISNKTA